MGQDLGPGLPLALGLDEVGLVLSEVVLHLGAHQGAARGHQHLRPGRGQVANGPRQRMDAEMGLDPDLKQQGRGGLAEEVVGPGRVAAVLGVPAQGGENDDGDAGGARIGLDRLAGLESVHGGHDHIHDHQIR